MNEQAIALSDRHPTPSSVHGADRRVEVGRTVARPLSDLVLWERVRSGDAEALGQLFERHGNAVFRYCFRLIGDWATAEDMTSAVFLEALRHRNQEIPDGFVRAWLFGITTNVLRNARRSRRRHAAALARLPRDVSVDDEVEGLLTRLDDERHAQAILDQLKELPRRDREVLFMVVLGELSYEETAHVLGIPLGTVRSRLSRAKARLRELESKNGRLVTGLITGSTDQ